VQISLVDSVYAMQITTDGPETVDASDSFGLGGSA
jgi:hypothetical protein